MKTEELIKESIAEALSAIEGTAKEVTYLLDTIKSKDEEIAALKAANLDLRAHAIKLKTWTTERIAEQFPKQVSGSEDSIKAAIRY